WTLKCYQCASPLGNCSQQVVCNPAGNYKCTTTAITVTNANQGARQIIKSCGICTEPVSFNTGVFTYFQGSKCCTSDLCNDVSHQVEENTALNGVECYACHNGSVATCTSSTSIVKCVGIQNRCAYTYIQLPVSGQHAVVKGCDDAVTPVMGCLEFAAPSQYSASLQAAQWPPSNKSSAEHPKSLSLKVAGIVLEVCPLMPVHSQWKELIDAANLRTATTKPSQWKQTPT
ncbi:hypothetical protein scyTo_0019109, partial [Scyliorhinus torazame]|nr:hypothetical protein [Scyliorhinus torazame]